LKQGIAIAFHTYRPGGVGGEFGAGGELDVDDEFDVAAFGEGDGIELDDIVGVV